MAVVGGSVVMFGGHHVDPFNDINTVALLRTTAAWVELSGVGDFPGKLVDHVAAVLGDGRAADATADSVADATADATARTVSDATAHCGRDRRCHHLRTAKTPCGRPPSFW